MFRRRPAPKWLIDPSKAVFGSVVDNIHRNLSRSHVRVKYHHRSDVQFVALAIFVKRCNELIRAGRSLDIEHLRVAPILKRRYAKFFDRLTDWGPATRRALSARPRRSHPVLHQR